MNNLPCLINGHDRCLLPPIPGNKCRTHEVYFSHCKYCGEQVHYAVEYLGDKSISAARGVWKSGPRRKV